MERAKYSELIICTLIKYIYFGIKSKLERKGKRIANKYIMLELHRNNKKTTLLPGQACFVIAHSPRDFIDKNIHNHRLYTIKIT